MEKTVTSNKYTFLKTGKARIVKSTMDEPTSEASRGPIPVQRDEGDGSAAPGSTITQLETRKAPEKPFTVKTEVDVMQWVLFFVGIGTRMWKLDQPKSVNFDELHFGRYAALYLKNTFYFDIHPPLGKLLFAMAGSYGGFDPEFKFEKIGGDYPASVSVWHLRFFPAFFSALTVPVIYEMMVELGSARWTAALAASLFILDNSLIVHARCTVMEGMIVFFVFLSLLSFLKLKNLTKSNAFGLRWWVWSVVMAISCGCAPSIKYAGMLGILLLLALNVKHLWNLLSCVTLSNIFLIKYVSSKIVFLVMLPIGIYISIFYAHLSILTKAGPNDDIMTSVFQASLEGGLAAITKGQPLEVAYGSQITLRRTHGGQPCWLHSHNHTYPLRYPDKRGSSYQQQVTCYNFKDVNNWWIIKHPNSSSSPIVEDPPVAVKDGDIIELVHGMTSRLLNSHNVAAPLTPNRQEVSCFIDWRVNATLQSKWKVQIINKEAEGDTWKTIKSQVKLIHVNTSQILRTSGKTLPDWGFYQNEVVTDRDHNLDTAVFNVEEHRYSRSQNQSEEDKKKELLQAKLLPMKRIELSFWAKFLELQTKMLTSRHDANLEHKYSSDPYEWPLFDRNVAYWLSSSSNAQIHLVGNLVLWYTGSISVVVFGIILAFHLLRRRRACYDISEERWQQFVGAGEVLFAGYLLHYIPYLAADRTMFVYSYLPALCFALLLTAFLMEHISILIWSMPIRTVYLMLVVVWFTVVVNVFITFLPITYGFRALSYNELQQLRWKDTWDFLWSKKFQ